MTIHITLDTMRYLLFFVFILSLIALMCGTLPDNKVDSFWNKSRYVLWPLLGAIVMFFFIRGIVM